MLKKGILILSLLMIALLAASASAQEDALPWSAYLYEALTGTVTEVGSDGSVLREVVLPLAQGFNSYGPGIAVSPSGEYIAYVMADTSNPEELSNRQVAVVDTVLSSIVATYALSPDVQAVSFELGLGQFSFDETNRRFALGSVLVFLGGTGVPGGWEVVVLDLVSGTSIARLASDEPVGQSINPDTGLIVPVIASYENDQVTFMTVYYATEGLPQYPTYTWDTASGQISEAPVKLGFGQSTLPATGETLNVTLDERLPAGEPPEIAPIALLNAVSVYDPASGETYVIYNEPEQTLTQAVFVQNGERVLISAFQDDIMAPPLYTLIERDGTVVAQPELPQSAYPILGTPDGFVYMEAPPQEGGSTTLVHVNTREGDFTPQVVYSIAPEKVIVTLVNVRWNAPAPESFTPWAQLVEPR
ncbi:MAG: hypothetical protein SF029_10825 [bacterium]|nr:hypothetical protein [bacterium]